jgi:hypothetical protein
MLKLKEAGSGVVMYSPVLMLWLFLRAPVDEATHEDITRERAREMTSIILHLIGVKNYRDEIFAEATS